MYTVKMDVTITIINIANFELYYVEIFVFPIQTKNENVSNLMVCVKI